MPFQIHSLPAEPFQRYFDMSAEELAAEGAHVETVKKYPGSPCRVSMDDARVGEKVVLLNYEHQPENSPYKASHAIFVRQGVEQVELAVNEVPAALSTRLISIRGFDGEHFMREADVVDGAKLAETIEAVFSNEKIDYIHLHNARPGCFAAKLTRA